MTRYRIVLAALLLAAVAIAAPLAQAQEHAPPAAAAAPATPPHETPASAPKHDTPDMRLRVAKREPLEVGANLAVNVASDRIRTSITTDDQTRLVDRSASQIGTGRGEARQ